MRALFVDTGGWMGMADAADPRHEMCRVARDEWLRRGGILLSTDYVLDETLTLIRLRLGLRTASQWWDQIEGSRRVLWEWVNPQREPRRHEAGSFVGRTRTFPSRTVRVS